MHDVSALALRFTGKGCKLKKTMYFERDIEDYTKYCFDVIKASKTPMSPNVHSTFPYYKTHVIVSTFMITMFDVVTRHGVTLGCSEHN
jgi:hypothetical protein